VAASWVLHLRGQTLTTMTLLGLVTATALIVEDVIGDIGEIRRRQRLGGPDKPSLSSVVVDVVAARRGPLLVATVIAIFALVPIAVMGGISRAFSWPLVVTFVLALAVSLAAALIVTPALAVLLLKEGHDLRTGPLDHWVERAVGRVSSVINKPGWVGIVAGLFAVAGVLVATLAPSGPALPTLQDRNVLVRLQGAPGMSLSEMNRITSIVAAEMRTAPGVEAAGGHVGRAITADEVVDVNAGDIWLTIGADADYDETLASVQAIAQGYPGLRSTVGTYAEDQLTAAAKPVPADVVVRVYGPDLATLRDTADDVRSVLSTIRGVLQPQVEAQVSEPTVEIEVDLAAAQRHGLRPGDVRREASTLISGLTVGSLYEQQKVFDVVVWGGAATRHSISDLEGLLIDTPSGGHVRLGEVADVRIAPDPVAIAHQSVSRSLDVTAAVNGRSASDVAAEVTSRLRGMSLPYEYRAEVLGAAADHQAEVRRVTAVALIVALLSFLILQAATGSWRLAGALLVTVPVAVVGGVLVAPAVGGVRSIGVLAALFALFALTLRWALTFVHRAREIDDRDRPPIEAVQQTMREQAPAIVGTVIITAAILAAPAVFGRSAGLELLHPFAISMLAGLLTAAAVAVIAVPTWYLVVANRRADPATADATPETQPEVKS
jgi:Cu/Ag efflux pump CusA